MIYVLDTSAIVSLKNFYPTVFASLWERLNSMIDACELLSVHEVFNELNNYNDTDFIQDWAKQHRAIFAKPSREEQLMVQRILAVPHFQSLVGQKAIFKGTPVADPFVVAAGKVHSGTVVTQERMKPNAAKIPNVCKHFGVPCVNLEEFMTSKGWLF